MTASPYVAYSQSRRLPDGFCQLFTAPERTIQGFPAQPFVDISFACIGKVMEFHVSPDQPCYAPDESRVLMPPCQDVCSHVGAFIVVSIVSQPAFVDAADSRHPLGHIMKQGGIADDQILWRMGNDGQRVEPGIKRMERQ